MIIEFPKIEVRSGLSDDRKAVLELVRAVWMEVYGGQGIGGLGFSDREEHLNELIGDPADSGWVATLGHRVIGYCKVNSNCVEQLWIAERFRRRGMGRRLLRMATEDILHRGFRFAQAGCEDFNPAALSFLRSQGWKVISHESQPLQGGKRCLILIHSLDLAPP